MSFVSMMLESSISLSGVGIHTGQHGRVTVHPEESGGIRFIVKGVAIPALASFVAGTSRCTRLARNDASVDTVEHLLSALCVMGIRNASIEVEGPEIPILDGSALPWVTALRSAGLKKILEPVDYLSLNKPAAFLLDDSWYIAEPADSYQLCVVTHFDHPMLGIQTLIFDGDPARYEHEIAPARTFAREQEINALRAAGMALGGSLDNALILYPDRLSDLERVPQECCAHKMLDLIGDLSLIGAVPLVHITAIRPGHRANTAFANCLRARLV